METETEFEISDRAFSQIKYELGDPEIDLFASRINHKCKKYVSWRKDPFAFQIDAFTITWKNFFFYAFPPFSIISRVLKKIKKDAATGILIVPFWPTQPWYPIFNEMLIEQPLKFKPDIKLLLSTNRKPHLLWRSLTLVAGKLSGRRSP